MKNILENRQEKIIEELDRLCFQHNFGTLSKSDFDLLMFHQFMEAIRESNTYMSNYQIAKQLGITVQRVMALKEKEASKYPYTDDAWKSEFLEQIANTYEDKNGKISLAITDRRMYRELESFMENEGIGVEYNLNPNIFTANWKLFYEVIDSLFEGETKEVVDSIKDSLLYKHGLEGESPEKLPKDQILSFLKEFAAEVVVRVIESRVMV